MVKSIIIKSYECEICSVRHDTLNNAKECEAQGVPILLPIGTIFSQYKDIIFCVIKQYKKGHHNTYSTWACRDTSASDNAGGGKYCRSSSWDIISPPNKNIPAYKRMIKALKDAGIKPINYVEE